jgi:hypothetical protein
VNKYFLYKKYDINDRGVQVKVPLTLVNLGLHLSKWTAKNGGLFVLKGRVISELPI